VTAENVCHALPAERWSYFLQNADKLTPEDIHRLFPDEEIAEAAGVLEMISQTPEQLMLYNARLKLQRDEEARIIQARLEGEARGEARGRLEGRQEGFLAGRIVLLQELLGVRPSTAEELMRYDDTQLHDLAEQLQHQLRSRSSPAFVTSLLGGAEWSRPIKIATHTGTTPTWSFGCDALFLGAGFNWRAPLRRFMGLLCRHWR
jgi:hypothetical protein